MKPGNLLIQGAKSGGRREMRIRYTHIGSFGVRFFYVFSREHDFTASCY